ncbi:MAG: protein kinase [Chloroflexi bacterium]|nr:protein kinase [Chloroflexota bacterium]
MSNMVGQQIDNYRLDALLGEGGMGAVYRALDLNLNRPVALKVMHGQLARQSEFQKRFMQEAQAAARLNHPSIVNIYHFGARPDFLYMVMEFIPGLSLGATIRRLQQTGQVIEIRETLSILAQVADALNYAHKQGIVHRDIKPDNILLRKIEQPDRPGEPPIRAVVTDFGLAKLLEGGVHTATGTFMGTLPYMSPEQCLDKDLDGRSDLYSLGVMMYQLTTGQLPFDIKSPTDAVMKHMREVPPAPRLIKPGLPVAVELVIKKAISKQPDDRYATGEQMAQAMRLAATNLTAADVTTFAPPQATLSLMTQLLPDKSPVMPSHFDTNLTALPYEAQLIIAQQGVDPRSLPLNKQSLTIGRSAENDLSLTGEGVSRHHARIERTSTGWQVIDLGSTNGSFLAGGKLLANVPHVWEAGQVLRVGPFHLRWRGAAAPQPQFSPSMVPTYHPTAVQSVPPGGTQVFSTNGQLSIVLSPTIVEVMPGERVMVQVDLLNQGMTVDHFRVQIDDLPKTWLTIPQDTLQLMPGTRGTLTFQLHPARDGEAKAGSRPYRLRVMSTLNTGEAASVTGQLILKPYSDFYVDMRPTQLSDGQKARLLVKNDGNAPAEFRISGRDAAEAIRYTIQPDRLSVTPGERAVSEVTLVAKQRPFIGTRQVMPYSMVIRTSADEQKTVNGQLSVPPRLPVWLIPLLGLLFLFLCLSGAFALNSINTANRNATATAEALVFVETQRGTVDAQSLQATGEAATATAAAAALAGDDDGDGLSNNQELTLGTDPNKADTDGDGLSDGQEVNQHGTDPKKLDSDGDTLSDGDEVNVHKTSPTEADTDGDGVRDGVEVNLGSDPLLPPTATLPPTTEPTTAPTATASPTTLIPTHTPTPTAFPAGFWHGIWETECEYLICGEVVLTHVADQNTVSGSFAEGAGTLVGIFEDNWLKGTWSASGQNGSFDFWIAPDGQTWYGNWNKSYDWCGYRSGGTAPEPCGVSSWYGDWDTNCGASGCAVLTLEQNGEFVEGTYANGEGTVVGTVDRHVFRGDWFRGSGTGALEFFMRDEGTQFAGNYNDEFAWCGHRTGAAFPDPCLDQGITIILPPIILVTLQPILPIIPLPTATP